MPANHPFRHIHLNDKDVKPVDGHALSSPNSHHLTHQSANDSTRSVAGNLKQDASHRHGPSQIPNRGQRNRPLASASDQQSAHYAFPPPRMSSLPPSQAHTPSHQQPAFHRFQAHISAEPSRALPETSSAFDCIRSCMPFILWGITSIGFVFAIALYRAELFQALDDMSTQLQQEGWYGKAVIFMCIFITTFPPLPLYSTFIVLSGYTFGARDGFIISYTASLVGAVVVYGVSFRFMREYLSSTVCRNAWMKRILRSIERKPRLLFLIRLAPYPYNLLNALLAASPSLTFRTYCTCTALSLFKLIIHTSAGSTIHRFADYHAHGGEEDEEGSKMTKIWSGLGIALCVGLFIYLSHLARKAVAEEDEMDVEAALGPDTWPPISGEMREVTGPRRVARS